MSVPPEDSLLDPTLAPKVALVASRTGSAVVIGDASGCVQWVNEAFQRITGYPSSEIVGKRLDLLGGEGDPGEDAIDYVLARFGRGEASRLEIPARTRSGRTLWLDLEVQPVEGEGGSSDGFIALATDVTERKVAEQALAESEERYRQLVELSPDPIGVHCEGRWVFLNPLAAHLLGAPSPDELIGRSVMDFVHADSSAAVEERIRRILDTGESSDPTEVKIVRSDGQVVEVELAGGRVRYQGKPAVQLVVRDLTSRRRAETRRWVAASRRREGQHSESLRTLARGLGHDFNNRLATILGEVDLALAELPERGGELRESLRSIRRESLRAARLTGQLLAYSGRGGRARDPVDLSTLVMESSDLLENAVRDRGLLNLDLDGHLPAVLGDPAQLRQVVLSLVQNAAEALGSHGGTVTVRTSLGPVKGDASGHGQIVRLEVVDNGCGMDRATLSRVFEPFFTTRFAGRGLGLAAVQGIVHAHRGSVRITSQPGSGTTVVVDLPGAPQAIRPKRRRRRKTPQQRARTVLVVEDEEALRDVARRVLERAGFTVRTARNGREGVTIFRDRPKEFGAVLLDLTMPVMDGAEALRELRVVQPDVRVVLTTSYSDPTDAVPLEDLAAFLAKPYEAAQLVEAVRQALER